jgi:hypothetical protein
VYHSIPLANHAIHLLCAVQVAKTILSETFQLGSQFKSIWKMVCNLVGIDVESHYGVGSHTVLALPVP